MNILLCFLAKMENIKYYICSPINQTISFSCRKFETFGILCCHALKVFDILDIKIIPDAYILKRWTREAKNGYVIDGSGRDVHKECCRGIRKAS